MFSICRNCTNSRKLESSTPSENLTPEVGRHALESFTVVACHDHNHNVSGIYWPWLQYNCAESQLIENQWLFGTVHYLGLFLVTVHSVSYQ